MKFSSFLQFAKDNIEPITDTTNAIALAWFLFVTYPHLTEDMIPQLAFIDSTGVLVGHLLSLCSIAPNKTLSKDDRATYKIFYDSDFITDLRDAIAKEEERRRKQATINQNKNKKEDLDWSYVTFLNDKIRISNPYGGLGIIIKFPQSKEDFNKIKSVIGTNCPKLIVRYKDGNICEVLNLEVISKSVVSLNSSMDRPIRRRDNTLKTIKKEASSTGKPKEIQVEQVKVYLNNKSSFYFDLLCLKQTRNRPVYYCLEQKVSSDDSSSVEKAFMFTIEASTKHWIIVFENTNAKRCTVLFHVTKKCHKNAVDEIHKYFISGEINKRETLQTKKHKFSNRILAYDRIYHHDHHQWAKEVIKHICIAESDTITPSQLYIDLFM